MTKGNPVRETTLFVVKNSEHVKINMERLQSLAHRLSKPNLSVPGWTFDFHLKAKDEKMMLDYIILLDATNFCFWAKKGPRWEFEYDDKKWNGYFALALALKTFFEKNPEKGKLEYFKDISFDEFKKILQGGKRLLFLKERWKTAKEVSAYILKKYKNSKAFIKNEGGSFAKLVPQIAKIPSFDDVHEYKGKKVYILKRAQILAGDIMGEFNNKGIGHFKDLGYLTAFADYKIPQILNSWGVLEYTKRLEEKIQKGTLIKSGSEEEVEIRSATIWAVEYLCKELKELGMDIYPYQIDWILWNESQKIQLNVPYHKTETIYY